MLKACLIQKILLQSLKIIPPRQIHLRNEASEEN